MNELERSLQDGPGPPTPPVPTVSSSFWRESLIRATAIVIAVAVLYSVLTLARPIAVLLASIIIAVALEPIVERLQRWMPRAAAAIVVYGSLVLIVVVIVTAIGVTVANEVDQVIEQAPSKRDDLVDLVDEFDPLGDGRLIDLLEEQRSGLSGMALRVPLQISSAILEIVIAFFLSIYWVLAAPNLRRFFLQLLPPDGKREQASEILDSMGWRMGGYVRAIAIDGLILATATYIGLLLLDVRFPIVLAMISGLAVLVPIIGPIAAAIPALAIALIDSPLKALAVLAFYIGLQQIESNILLPKIMQRQADINPLLGVFAVFAGGSIGGILGALIAVPTAGAIQVLVTDVLAPAIRNNTPHHIIQPSDLGSIPEPEIE